MARLLPILLVVIGLGLGSIAGLLLRPESATTAEGAVDAGRPDAENKAEGSEAAPESSPGNTDGAATEFVRLNNQFVIPVVEGGKVASLVVLSLSVEVLEGGRELVFTREPKLRDAFLTVMFDHANVGGFSGLFTDSAVLSTLRAALRESAMKVLGETMRDVLVIDIVRQDLN